MVLELPSIPSTGRKELGRRYLDYHFSQTELSLHSSHLVLDYLRYELKGEKQEVFAVLCLDAELRKLHFKSYFWFSSTLRCFSESNLTLCLTTARLPISNST